MDIFYQNSRGKRVYLDRGAYKMLAKSSLWDYEWNYSTNNYNGRPQMSIRRKSAKRNISVVVSAGTVTECMQKLSELSDFFDIDVVTGTAGRIYVGSGYLKCYVIKSTKSGKYVQTRKTTVAFDVLPDGEEWIYEMVVYGPCENPEILMGSHKYHVNCQLETGEYLVINSLSKKIYKVKNDGEQVNQYNLQDRDWYVFQKIASGSHSVSWSGLFGFDITMYERRSEPKWT